MELDIHNAVKITRSIIYDKGISGRFWRTIKITTDKGEEIEITCWSDSFSNLIIKEEK